MKIRSLGLVLLMAVQVAGCTKSPEEFSMKVDRVDELKGMILKGISITGKIEKGCIANDDEFVVQRAGKEVLRTTTRVVNVDGLTSADSFTGEVKLGDVVTFYIPDGKKEDVQVGDLVTSKTTTCGKNKEK